MSSSNSIPDTMLSANVLNEQSEAQREIDASILNLSGRQRMLSQRIALFLMRLALCEEVDQCQMLRQELRDLLDMLASTHQALMRCDVDLCLPSEQSEAIHQIYFAPPVQLDQRLTRYVELVEGFLVQPGEALSIDNPKLQQLISVDSVELLQALETLVSQYAKESEARQTQTMEELIQLCQRHESALQTVRFQAEQLNQTLNQLYQTQAQLLQSKKMQSLGHLVAGVAHEINNPVTFIHGNLRYVRDYTEDLMLLVKSYQKYYPEPVSAISERLDVVDVDFLICDLPKTIDSMRSGTKRLEEIVVSLRSFARLDEAEYKAVDLYDGLNSTLLLLQHRLHQFEQCHSQCIEIKSDYAELPKVLCFASQINQVFMALLLNAIDAIDARFVEDQKEPTPQISIVTQYIESEQIIVVQVSDNGVGIVDSQQSKIFDPFFTTKPVGQGAGMGLAICYQIMEQHSGQIICESELGQGAIFRLTLPCPLGD